MWPGLKAQLGSGYFLKSFQLVLPFGRKSTGPVGVAHTHSTYQGRGSRKAPDTSAQAVKKGQLGSGVPIDLSIG